jgi:hypothetical protein
MTGNGAGATHMGIYNQVNGTDGAHYGVYHFMTGSTSGTKIGAYSNLNSGTGNAYGFYANATGSGANYGAYLSASSGSTNYALYAANGTSYFADNVGIGTTTPDYTLDVESDLARAVAIENSYTGSSSKYGIHTSLDEGGTGVRYGIYSSTTANALDNSSTYGMRSYATGNGNAGSVYGLYASVGTSGTGNRYAVYGSSSTTEPNPGVTRSWAGYFAGNTYFSADMRIGWLNDVPGYLLAVDGKIICEELKVQASGDWPDYVFAEEYDLPTLDEVEAYIEENNHLLGVPDACTVEEEGIMIGQMQKVMMEKIEELTLYMIDANKQIVELKKEVKELKNSK